MSSLINEIRGTDEYKKFKKIVAKCLSLINVERDRTEALSMHSGRTSRMLYGQKRYSPKALIDASLNDLACRSRMVEMRVQISVQIDLLHDAIKSMKHYISTQFVAELKHFGTVDVRAAFAERVLKAALAVQSEGQALIKLLDDLINDCDKSSFHLRTMMEALKLLDESKGGKVL